jgi:hypothetical protein
MKLIRTSTYPCLIHSRLYPVLTLCIHICIYMYKYIKLLIYLYLGAAELHASDDFVFIMYTCICHYHVYTYLSLSYTHIYIYVGAAELHASDDFVLITDPALMRINHSSLPLYFNGKFNLCMNVIHVHVQILCTFILLLLSLIYVHIT